jgi:hypothetical protein
MKSKQVLILHKEYRQPDTRIPRLPRLEEVDFIPAPSIHPTPLDVHRPEVKPQHTEAIIPDPPTRKMVKSRLTKEREFTHGKKIRFAPELNMNPHVPSIDFSIPPPNALVTAPERAYLPEEEWTKAMRQEYKKALETLNNEHQMDLLNQDKQMRDYITEQNQRMVQELIAQADEKQKAEEQAAEDELLREKELEDKRQEDEAQSREMALQEMAHEEVLKDRALRDEVLKEQEKQDNDDMLREELDDEMLGVNYLFDDYPEEDAQEKFDRDLKELARKKYELGWKERKKRGLERLQQKRAMEEARE